MVEFNEISPNMINAIVSIEDKRFYNIRVLILKAWPACS
jgi:membrane peptidoglycan carboxypeptidase